MKSVPRACYLRYEQFYLIRLPTVRISAWLVLILVAPPFVRTAVVGQSRLNIDQVAEQTFPHEPRPSRTENPSQNRVAMDHMNVRLNAFSVIFQSQDAKSAQTMLEQEANLRIAAIDEVCQLSPIQKTKLELMAKGEVHQFLFEIEHVCRQSDKQVDPNHMAELFQQIDPFRQRISQGFFATSPRFQGAIRGLVTEQQLHQLTELEKQRNAYAFEANVRSVIALIEEQYTPFTDQQRSRLVELAKGKEPATKIDIQLYSYFVYFQLSQQQEQLATILNAKQMDAIHPILDQGAAAKQMFEP